MHTFLFLNNSGRLTCSKARFVMRSRGRRLDSRRFPRQGTRLLSEEASEQGARLLRTRLRGGGLALDAGSRQPGQSDKSRDDAAGFLPAAGARKRVHGATARLLALVARVARVHEAQRERTHLVHPEAQVELARSFGASPHIVHLHRGQEGRAFPSGCLQG